MSYTVSCNFAQGVALPIRRYPLLALVRKTESGFQSGISDAGSEQSDPAGESVRNGEEAF